MALSTRILVIDLDPAFRREVRSLAESLGYQAVEVDSGRAGLAELGSGVADAVVVDLSIVDVPVRDIVAAVASLPAPRPALVVTGRAPSLEEAVDLMRRGVKDVLQKPATPERISEALTRAIESSELARDVRRLRRESEDMSAI